MPSPTPTPPLMPDGPPPPAVDQVFHAGLPPFAMPAPQPIATWTSIPRSEPAWIIAGRVLLTALHGFVVLMLGVAALFVLAFNDDHTPDQSILAFFLLILLGTGVPAGALIVLTGGIWLAKRWAYWATLVLYAGILGFAAFTWWGKFTHAAPQLTVGLLPPLTITLLVPLAVLIYLVLTWPPASVK